MRWLLAGLLLALVAPAAAKPKKKDRNPEPVEATPTPAPDPVPPELSRLFGDSLPIDVGGLPTGLGSLSAQGCNACHYDAHDGWAASAHATGWNSERFVQAVADVGTPACTVCHLPLASQHTEVFSLAAGDVNKPVTGANAGYDPTLHSEGVTCAACHVREGKVVASEHGHDGPHASTWTSQLGKSEACAPCHQLTWPGSQTPFYDTYGEWKRSPHAAAGLQCQDCHVRHDLDGTEGRGLTVLLELPEGGKLVRGADPVQVKVTLQNTGAGHAWPTGSPFASAAVAIFLEGPPADEGMPRVEDRVIETLGRTLSEGAPWTTTADTRLQAGEERSFEVPMNLDLNDPAGPWSLVVQVSESVRGRPVDRPRVVRRVPLQVE